MTTPITPAPDRVSASVFWLILAVVATGSAVGYGVACWWWPFTACDRCAGSGKRYSPTGRAWRKCRRCAGTGARTRTGRRIFDFLRKVGD